MVKNIKDIVKGVRIIKSMYRAYADALDEKEVEDFLHRHHEEISSIIQGVKKITEDESNKKMFREISKIATAKMMAIKEAVDRAELG